jgi:glutamate-5-semialdehyde dehydrogenase
MVLEQDIKNNVLTFLAELILKNKSQLIDCNKLDLEQAGTIDATLADRLKVDAHKVDEMLESIANVIRIEDPQGKILYEYNHPNGLLIRNIVVPFGRVLIIYESRPDVTIEAAISAFKAGNKILLKGGKEARNTNLFLVNLWKEALKKFNVPSDYVEYLDINREETQRMLTENTYRIDLIIPRGGDSLINYVKQNTSIPVMISGRGNNFMYVHTDADFAMVIRLVMDGKSRLSVCNALDKVIFNKNISNLGQEVTKMADKLNGMGIEIFADGDFFREYKYLKELQSSSQYKEEFLSAKLLFCLADNMDEAIELININSGGHSAVIVTADCAIALEFQHKVDCAAVYHNASSRFTDGGQFGLGAEIAISTQKLHFRGPVSLLQLVTNKWFITGNGQARKIELNETDNCC